MKKYTPFLFLSLAPLLIYMLMIEFENSQSNPYYAFGLSLLVPISLIMFLMIDHKKTLNNEATE